MLDAYGLSDPGSVRTNNEDYYLYDRPNGIFILADGMGGAKAGEYASQLGTERLYNYVLAAESQADGNAADGNPLERGFLEANWLVRETAKTNPELEGMGTTLIAARTLGPQTVQISSVGDSRAYLAGNGRFARISKDQTWVAEVGPRLGLSAEALKVHPMRHVLTMAIGCADELRVHTEIVTLNPGDQILLCSDGLHGVVEESEIAEVLNSEKTLEEKCHYLIEAAKQNGAPDNVTVLLIQLV
ncbi:MAG TPA: protein phosphatase 2C domain-containing protein [Bryobacteraceae bacterium]|jgi:protein phosphatase|nr:protein phosphatase 2C domain-containing protein [Bryobacteraceae bacterium]